MGIARRKFPLAGAAGALIAALCMQQAQAQPPAPLWWPCVQAYVPTVSGSVAGAAPAAGDAWRDDAEAGALAKQLADREKTDEQAMALLEEHLAGNPSEAGLKILLAALHNTVNSERTQIIEGIKRFTKRQQAMAARIEAQSQELADKKRVGDKAARDLQLTHDWDIRVFDRREGMSRYLCEQPVRLERRYFVLGRAIAARLNPPEDAAR